MPEQFLTTDDQDAEHRLSCFRSRQAAKCLQDKFRERIRKHVTQGLKQADVPLALNDDVLPLMIDYGIARAKKRMSVNPEDFTRIAQHAEKLARRRNGAEALTSAKYLESLDDVIETARMTLEETQDRAVYRMVAANKDRPAFYDQELFKGEDRLYFELPQSPSEVAPVIEQALGAVGYTEMDYAHGFITNAYGDRTRIGKALQKHGMEALYEAFQRDPTRADPAVVMISRNAEDVARMSTDRGWQTCIVAGSHRFEQHMPEDLQQGMLVAYLIRPNDPEAYEPMAVMNLKPYSNDQGDTILVPNRVYGKADQRFPDFVKTVVDQAVNADKVGKFTMSRAMLSDDLDYEVERTADGTIFSKLTLMPSPAKPEGRQLPEGTKLGDRIAI